TSSQNTIAESVAAATLTIGPGITIRGQTGYIGYNPNQDGNPSAAAVVNLGTIQWTSGTSIVAPRGIINNGTMTNDATGYMNLCVTLTGGTLTTTAGAKISGGTLSGVTISGDWSAVGNNIVTVTSGLTINGTATVGNTSTFGVLRFSGSQTLGGMGTVVFG